MGVIPTTTPPSLRRWALAALACAAFFIGTSLPATAHADPLVLLGTGGAWRTAGTPAEDNVSPGTPYWDSNSWDTLSVPDSARVLSPTGYNPANIGALLQGDTAELVPSMAAHVGSPTYSLGPDAPGGFEYWADNQHDADRNFYFSTGTPTTYTIKMIAELCKRSTVNELGWYRHGDPAALFTIFTAADHLGSTWTGTIDGDFGFYYRDTTRGLLYFTETSMFGQTPGSGQQFAAMRSGGRYYVGLEDRAGPITEAACGAATCSDYDYNDIALSIEAQVVPEPATLVLLGTGIAGVVAARRRKRG